MVAAGASEKPRHRSRPTPSSTLQRVSRRRSGHGADRSRQSREAGRRHWWRRGDPADPSSLRRRSREPPPLCGSRLLVAGPSAAEASGPVAAGMFAMCGRAPARPLLAMGVAIPAGGRRAGSATPSTMAPPPVAENLQQGARRNAGTDGAEPRLRTRWTVCGVGHGRGGGDQGPPARRRHLPPPGRPGRPCPPDRDGAEPRVRTRWIVCGSGHGRGRGDKAQPLEGGTCRPWATGEARSAGPPRCPGTGRIHVFTRNRVCGAWRRSRTWC